jgi:hypothetical protein
MARKLDIPDDADLSPDFFKRLIKPSPSKNISNHLPSKK